MHYIPAGVVVVLYIAGRPRVQRSPATLAEMTIEEWIEWMEEKKKAGMTPAQLAELEKRKANWLQRQKEKEEKRKRIEDEQLAKTRKKMEDELM